MTAPIFMHEACSACFWTWMASQFHVIASLRPERIHLVAHDLESSVHQQGWRRDLASLTRICGLWIWYLYDWELQLAKGQRMWVGPNIIMSYTSFHDAGNMKTRNILPTCVAELLACHARVLNFLLNWAHQKEWNQFHKILRRNQMKLISKYCFLIN